MFHQPPMRPSALTGFHVVGGRASNDGSSHGKFQASVWQAQVSNSSPEFNNLDCSTSRMFTQSPGWRIHRPLFCHLLWLVQSFLFLFLDGLTNLHHNSCFSHPWDWTEVYDYYFQPTSLAEPNGARLQISGESRVYLCFLPQLRHYLLKLHYKSSLAEAWSTHTGRGGHRSLVIHKETPPHTLPGSPHWSERFQVSQRADSRAKSEKNSASRKSRDKQKCLKQSQAGRMIQRGGLYQRS